MTIDGGIGYIGAKRKFVSSPQFDVKVAPWPVFSGSPIAWKFHWAVRPACRMFEPETKVATAAKCGAIPIVSEAELGTLLPLDYPFCIDDVSSLEQCDRLRQKMEDEGVVQIWQNRLHEIVALTSLNNVAKAYYRLLRVEKS